MMLPRSSIGKLPVLLTNLITKKHLAATLSTVKKGSRVKSYFDTASKS